MSIHNQAVEAANGYLAQVDPYRPNYENVQQFLRGPLMALTVNNVLPASNPSSAVASLPVKEEEEEKKGGDWRDYLESTKESNEKVQEVTTLPG